MIKPGTRPPVGFEAICDMFGDPRVYLHNILSWERANIVTTAVDPMPYAYGAPQQTVSVIRVHRRLAALVRECLRVTAELGKAYSPERWAFGGCYMFRVKRAGNKLSTHAWGIAVDLGPKCNPYRVRWNPQTGIPEEIVKVWQGAGFAWGGIWADPDPMHFQFATRY